MALYSIRSERQFCERLQYDLLFKWFLDLNITDPAFDATDLQSTTVSDYSSTRLPGAFLAATVRRSTQAPAPL